MLAEISRLSGSLGPLDTLLYLVSRALAKLSFGRPVVAIEYRLRTVRSRLDRRSRTRIHVSE